MLAPPGRGRKLPAAAALLLGGLLAAPSTSAHPAHPLAGAHAERARPELSIARVAPRRALSGGALALTTASPARPTFVLPPLDHLAIAQLSARGAHAGVHALIALDAGVPSLHTQLRTRARVLELPVLQVVPGFAGGASVELRLRLFANSF